MQYSILPQVGLMLQSRQRFKLDLPSVICIASAFASLHSPAVCPQGRDSPAFAMHSSLSSQGSRALRSTTLGFRFCLRSHCCWLGPTWKLPESVHLVMLQASA